MNFIVKRTNKGHVTTGYVWLIERGGRNAMIGLLFSVGDALDVEPSKTIKVTEKADVLGGS